MTAATYIGVDLASGKGHAVLVEYVDGKIKSTSHLDERAWLSESEMLKVIKAARFKSDGPA